MFKGAVLMINGRKGYRVGTSIAPEDQRPCRLNHARVQRSMLLYEAIQASRIVNRDRDRYSTGLVLLGYEIGL